MKQNISRAVALLVALAVTVPLASAAPPGADAAADPTRPIYHLVSPLGEPHVADPNFAIFWKGRYHLFFICQGYAHVSSLDMVHWHPHSPFHGPLCSGGIFVNKEGRPTVITTSAWQNGKLVLYTALDDNLEKWSAPVAIEWAIRPGQDIRQMICWDPEIWVEGGTTYALQGVYPLATGKEATLVKSTDQKHWQYVGPFMTREMPDVMRSTTAAQRTRTFPARTSSSLATSGCCSASATFADAATTWASGRTRSSHRNFMDG